MEYALMHKHVLIVGILYIVLSAMSLVGAVFVFMVLAGSATVVGDTDVVMISSLVGLIVALFLAITAIPGLVAGYALIKGYNWGRILGLILAFLNLINIPFGTILGIYAFWALLHNDTIEYFKKHREISYMASA